MNLESGWSERFGDRGLPEIVMSPPRPLAGTTPQDRPITLVPVVPDQASTDISPGGITRESLSRLARGVRHDATQAVDAIVMQNAFQMMQAALTRNYQSTVDPAELESTVYNAVNSFVIALGIRVNFCGCNRRGCARCAVDVQVVPTTHIINRGVNLVCRQAIMPSGQTKL